MVSNLRPIKIMHRGKVLFLDNRRKQIFAYLKKAAEHLPTDCRAVNYGGYVPLWTTYVLRKGRPVECSFLESFRLIGIGEIYSRVSTYSSIDISM